MPRKGSRETTERGISRDSTGYSVRVSVGSGPHRRSRERRFPLTVDLKYLRAQRAELESELRSELQQHDPDALPIERGTWAADVRLYLGRMERHLQPATFKSRRSELAAWTAAIADTRTRYSLRHADVDRIIGQWKREKVSAKTLLNRLRTLKHLYVVLEGKRARTPADDIPLPKVPKTKPRDVEPKTIRLVIANLIRQERKGRLRDAKTRARFLVLATTGQRPAQLKRTKAEDVDLQRGIWWVPSAKGGEAVPLPLNQEMLIAWTLFAKADAWGAFDTRGFGRVIRRAGWPDHIRVYNARHSVGIALSERGVDIGDIAPFMSHTRIQTARDFYVPMLFSRLKAASDKLEGRLDLNSRGARYAGLLKFARNKRQKRQKDRGRNAS